jgi:hypothetical protein
MRRRPSQTAIARIRGLELYRSRPINQQAARRFPHVLYYAVHFDEELHRFAFAFLGPDGARAEPDVLTGTEAHDQWSRFCEVMTRDPALSGVRVERLGHHDDLGACVAAAREDAAARRPRAEPGTLAAGPAG